MARFDGYTATTREASADHVIGLALTLRERGDKTIQTTGYHGFQHKFAIKGDDGGEAISVLWGGRHEDLVMIEGKGERSPALVSTLRKELPAHRCTRADSCEDFEAPGVWEKFLPLVLDIKQRYGLRGEKRGDWDFPQDGRTQYLGSPKSAVRARMYEKGKQPEYRHLARWDWVRVECQVRPEKDARTVYASATATEVWGASPYTRDLAARLLEAQVRPLPAYSARRETERDRAIRVMCQQYGAHLVSLKDDVGDWACVGLTLSEIISENAARRRKLH